MELDLKSIIIFTLLSILSTFILADEIVNEMKKHGYIEKKVPKFLSKAWHKANSSSASHVSIDKSLVISENNESTSNLIFDADTVKYIGVNHGEFGGGLYLNKYSEDEKPFFNAIIQGLVPIKDDLYILSGLAHGNRSDGAIHVIRNFKKPSTPILITLLPDAPEAISIENFHGIAKKIVIVGHSSLIEFSPDSYFKIIVSNSFWESLYPTSIVQYHKSYFIGIRSGVAVITPNYYGRAKIRYFVPKL